MKLVFGVLLVLLCIASVQNLEARGWNDNIEWQTYEEGLRIAGETNKPMLIVLHKTWCGACKRLKPDFAANKDIEALSKQFVMVNAEDDEAPHAEPKYQLDGGYIPRIYFGDSKGDVLPYSNPTRSDYKYFYPSSDQIVESMKKVLRDFTN